MNKFSPGDLVRDIDERPGQNWGLGIVIKLARESIEMPGKEDVYHVYWFNSPEKLYSRSINAMYLKKLN